MANSEYIMCVVLKLHTDDYNSRFLGCDEIIAKEIEEEGDGKILARFDSGCSDTFCACHKETHKKIWFWELNALGHVFECVTYDVYKVVG